LPADAIFFVLGQAAPVFDCLLPVHFFRPLGLILSELDLFVYATTMFGMRPQRCCSCPSACVN
jgi:hypothetical protein